MRAGRSLGRIGKNGGPMNRSNTAPSGPSGCTGPWMWIDASGRGTVHSWTITHYAFHPGFKGDLPYLLLTVDLKEGVRMQAQARGITIADVKVGMPVRVVAPIKVNRGNDNLIDDAAGPLPTTMSIWKSSMAG